jgi:hypothetical protein
MRARTRGIVVAVVVAAVVSGVAVIVAVAARGPGGHRTSTAEPAPTSVSITPGSDTPSAPPSATPSGAARLAAPPTTAAPSPTRPKISPSKKPTQVPLPPAPPHPTGPEPTSPAPGATCPTYTGPGATKAAVRSALDTAAGTHFWATSAPSISVPVNLMHAVAWQESGWQSTILACDGGIGTMQVMPATADWMNQRFGTSYDVHTLSGNTMLGAEYLEWLVKYFGDVYFQGSYDLSVPAVPDGVSLLDSVVSAYNYGAGAVDPTKGRAGIPNWWYVDDVEALTANCPCGS